MNICGKLITKVLNSTISLRQSQICFKRITQPTVVIILAFDYHRRACPCGVCVSNSQIPAVLATAWQASKTDSGLLKPNGRATSRWWWTNGVQ
jgi:hypothetical protein